MIQVINLTKRYGPKAAIHNISFSIGDSEVIGVFGPGGAGKTTLVRLLAGCALPSHGRVSVCGYDTATHGLEVRKRVGYLTQKAAIYTDMTVENFLTYAARLHHLENYDQRVEECLATFNLSDCAKVLIERLSHFQRQEIRLVQVLLHQPSILILDEPTAGFDPEQIVGLHRLIKASLGNRTVILATQIWSEVEQFCNRALVLNDGCLAKEYDLRGLVHPISH
ncbi:MAG TPA: ABC transporter ATP-binding protein [Anaerolineae bacterium]|nr:ABC transporter ATP-binding protein [Anaerolineae bacterium]HMR64088.1 ABC transporter ATP-binding protein [Anaerolineae bacterium]